MPNYHAMCVYCGSVYCTCFDTDDEYLDELRKHRREERERQRRLIENVIPTSDSPADVY